ncbi:MAG TPA: hypothetical protein VGB56_02400, partial [Flavisolibacter sp.]
RLLCRGHNHEAIDHRWAWNNRSFGFSVVSPARDSAFAIDNAESSARDSAKKAYLGAAIAANTSKCIATDHRQ